MILIDGNLLAHRAFHKLDFMKNKAGDHTGMEYGFLRSVEYLEKTFPDHKIVICFDTKYNKKKEGSKRYKATRSKMTDTFYNRLTVLQSFLRQFWDQAWCAGEEADDVLYTLAKKQYGEVIIYSNDNDLLQCVDDEANITVLKSHESNLYRYDEEKVQDKYGIAIEHLVMFRSFIGDTSDNLSGVPRIQKAKLINAIHRAEDLGLTAPDEIARSIPRYTGWSVNMEIKIEAFVVSGLWAENYELMKLQEVVPVYSSVREKNEEWILKTLRKWEIGSLRLCEPYKQDLVDPELEF